MLDDFFSAVRFERFVEIVHRREMRFSDAIRRDSTLRRTEYLGGYKPRHSLQLLLSHRHVLIFVGSFECCFILRTRIDNHNFEPCHSCNLSPEFTQVCEVMPVRLVLNHDETLTNAQRDRFGAAAGVQLGHDRIHVKLHRVLRNAQLVRN